MANVKARLAKFSPRTVLHGVQAGKDAAPLSILGANAARAVKASQLEEYLHAQADRRRLDYEAH